MAEWWKRSEIEILVERVRDVLIEGDIDSVSFNSLLKALNDATGEGLSFNPKTGRPVWPKKVADG